MFYRRVNDPSRARIKRCVKREAPYLSADRHSESRDGARGKERRLMREDIAGVGSESSRPTWEELEGWVRERAQEFIQGILEEEVTEAAGP